MTELPDIYPEQLPPVVTSPEDLIQQGLMPQIPYDKTPRVPEGWGPLAASIARTATRGRNIADIPGPVTERHLTLARGRIWAAPGASDDEAPNISRRLALMGISTSEGTDPEFWVIASEYTDEARNTTWSTWGWTRDRAAADESFRRAELRAGVLHGK